MSGARLNLEWRAPGPVAARFMASSAMVQFLNGPVGSGKTTAVMIKLIKLARQQAPSTRDTVVVDRQRLPVRKFKVCCVRDTYRQLWATTLPSWFKRIPKEAGEFSGSAGGPASHRVTFAPGDGTAVDFLIEFIAIGENAVEDVLRGYEPTCFYLNEADLLAKEVYTYARGRAGRYPDMSEGGPSWYGVLGDCNAPELINWLYQDIFKSPPEGVDLFRQPSGLSADAENLANLPAGYYANQTDGQPDHYVDRMVKNIAGLSPASSMQFIGRDLVDAACSPLREPRATLYDPLVIGVDVARYGDDSSTIYFRRGRDARSIPPIKFSKTDTMFLAARIFETATSRNAAAVFVDGGGVGGGVIDRLRQLRLDNVFEIQFGAASDRIDYGEGGEPIVYANKRAEMWGTMKGWLKTGAICDDPGLIGDLTAVQYSYVQRDGRDAILLEPKEAMKKRGLSSPDDGDGLALTFAYPVAATSAPQVGRTGGRPKALPDWDPLPSPED